MSHLTFFILEFHIGEEFAVIAIGACIVFNESDTQCMTDVYLHKSLTIKDV